MNSARQIQRHEPQFPTNLRDLPGWPNVLYCHGSLQIGQPAVSIVGARSASARARTTASQLAADLAAEGHGIVSGGALGVDSAAHQGALAAEGHTVAVMACGLDQYYPKRNQWLFEAMRERGGAVVSPYEPGAAPLRGRFVKRNQVIAALADAVIVVEASTNSGSLHTARFAMRLGRRLAVVPGSPGCELLLAEGVPPVADAGDVLSLLRGEAPKCNAPLPETDSPEGQVLELLTDGQTRSLADLCSLARMPVRKAQRVLGRLHLDLLVIALPGQRYRISRLASQSAAAGP